MARVRKTNCPFTLVEYRALLRLAKGRFPIIGYPEHTRHPRFVIWRHDLDCSPEEMHRLAALDAEEGVRATLFIQLHSEFYHFWDARMMELVKQWTAWGHAIGLHFDWGFHRQHLPQRLEELIRQEATFLVRVYQTNISAFAYHNPDPTSLKHREHVAGLINAYSKDLMGEETVYVSDSNGRWRERTARDVLEDPKTTKAQINTHDTWWTDERIPQIEKLEKALRREAERRIDLYRSAAIVVVEDII